MAEKADIARIVAEVVNANTAPDTVQDVETADILDSTGEEALRISITLAPNAADLLREDVPLAILVQLRHKLQDVNEARFPIVDYATADELAAEAHGDTQS